MHLISIFIISLCVSMDAFGVSISNGMLIKKPQISFALTFGCFFGFFQFLMPILGYICSIYFSASVLRFEHFISFGLLLVIGGKMVFESLHKDDDKNVIDPIDITSFKNMIILAIATSIDAMAVGVMFKLMEVNIIFTSVIIGSVTFVFSTIGAYLGGKISRYFKNGELIGGIILIIIGLKILFEHLF